ncbi:unnamed protein product [Phaedon cochleariae]|uniref:LIM zinc-binding domain-containing protein n=1 Tax=Phaedon cochleariae TaxID=80249 RepID=A0A9N9SHY7_PHACE|nr:unnamed protein product [Phaedon cochleariae]
MTAICFVCNLPILSHQVGLVWQGGNGWDDLVREQVEEMTIRQRLGGRRDSATQLCNISPPGELADGPNPGNRRRRRSSLAQLTDLFRDWGSSKKNQKKLYRRETLADLVRTLPWEKQSESEGMPTPNISTQRNRRESSADSGIRSSLSRSRRDSHSIIYDFKAEVAKLWHRKDSRTATIVSPSSGHGPAVSRRDSEEYPGTSRRDSTAVYSQYASRRGSGESGKGRRDSVPTVSSPPRVVSVKRKVRTHSESPYYRFRGGGTVDVGTGALPPPTIVMSSVTPPATSPTVQSPSAGQQPPPVHPLVGTRRDSTTQCGRTGRRDSRTHSSPEQRHSRLQRQNTAYDESCLPPGGWTPKESRRDSQTTALSPDVDESGRKARRDSLSPDSASKSRRDSRSRLSPDRSMEREISPVRRNRRTPRRQSTTVGRPHAHRSPDSSSCSSRDPSPSNRGNAPPPVEHHRPAIRRQSTTEEILIARGFRRQSTTEEMIRCRNFRRQSSQSDDSQRYRGRRDSSTQILDGTVASMTVETSSTVFDSSTQTDPTPLYENNHYHEECLRCNSCGLNLTGPSQKRARRFKNQILCDLHFADVSLMETSDFMQQLRSFKPQSLGVVSKNKRRQGHSMNISQCRTGPVDEFCEEYPHNFVATAGYWIECSRQKITTDTIWDESESEHENDIQEGEEDDEENRKDRCHDLYEDDEDSSSPKKKTVIEEQWEKNQGFELTSVEQETYEKYFYVRTSPRIKRKPTRYEVSVVSRDEVGAYKPYLWEQSVFDKEPMFREWLLTKIVNGERASYSAPKFARMQDRTRSQMLEDIVRSRVFQEMLYGIQAGFGSPQVPVAELLARPVPSILSPQQMRPKSSNFLQV